MGSFRYPVEEIREHCNLVEIISQHVALRKRGKTLVGLCPFHNEKTASFTVTPERQSWMCYGCGEGGDVFSFVQKIDNVTFAEAVEHLAQKAGIKIEHTEQAAKQYSEKDRIFKANNIACAFYRSQLGKSKKAKDYLARRGLSESTAEKYRLGYASENWSDLFDHLTQQRVSPADAVKAGLIIPRENSTGFYDRFRDRLIFPILDTSERVIAFGGRTLGDDVAKYLNSPETPLFSKSKTLYGLNIARRVVSKEDKLLIVEGYMDVIAAQEAGFENTVATLGTALTEEHVRVIERFTKNVVLSFDADSAGIAAALRSSPIFERAGLNVRILSMPTGEDPDSLLRGGDTSKFANLLEKALPVPDYRVKLVLLRHNLKSDEGKTAALKEAIGVLAEIDSVVERERLVRLLARYHPNFSTGTTLAEDHLRTEINRLITRGGRNKLRDMSRTEATGGVNNKAAVKLTLVEHSEKLLLGMIIICNIDPNKVFEALPPNEFTREDARSLAEAVNRQYTELGKIDQENLRTNVSGTPAESLLTNLLVDIDDSQLNHPIEELVRVIINHNKNERRQRMRALAEKFEEGSIKRGDEEYEEYMRLVRETSNPWRR